MDQTEEKCTCVNCRFNEELPRQLSRAIAEDKGTMLHVVTAQAVQHLIFLGQYSHKSPEVMFAGLLGTDADVQQALMDSVVEAIQNDYRMAIDLYNAVTYLLGVFADKVDWKAIENQLARAYNSANALHPHDEEPRPTIHASDVHLVLEKVQGDLKLAVKKGQSRTFINAEGKLDFMKSAEAAKDLH